MTTLDEEFKNWMADKRLRAADVGKVLDVSAQTIRNWRSSSIPKRKYDAVRRIMREWNTNPLVQFGPRLVLNPTQEQMRAWNQAANDSPGGPQLLEDWARAGLNELAAEYLAHAAPHLTAVADEVGTYRVEPAKGQSAGK